MMIEFHTTFFIRHPPRMMIGFHISLKIVKSGILSSFLAGWPKKKVMSGILSSFLAGDQKRKLSRESYHHFWHQESYHQFWERSGLKIFLLFYSSFILFYSILFYSILFYFWSRPSRSICQLLSQFSHHLSQFSATWLTIVILWDDGQTHDDRIPVLTFFFDHPPRMMTGFLTSLLFGLPAENDDRIPDLTLFFGHPANNYYDRIPDVTFFLGYPPRMMIGFLTSLSFWVTFQEWW